ncbi:germination protein YpeB [Oscillospiraceae bacterium MB08-C2-2]|nr:germination protein YpeB [Oscillospiraceae bacterium MB08-C2-2]
MSFTKRQLVRTVSFTCALVLALFGGLINQYIRVDRYQRQVEQSYTRSLQELSSQLNSIITDLEKTSYAGTPAQISALSAKILKNSGTAKAAFASLPAGEFQMENTYRFLSQVGDYSMFLAKKAGQQQQISDEERASYKALLEHAKILNEQVSYMEALLRSGQISVQELLDGYVLEKALELPESTLEEGTSVGFKAVEDGMTGYPTLIYDGPFSDNILEKDPQMTKGMNEISQDEARDKAAAYAKIDAALFTQSSEEKSRMPSYTFGGKEYYAAVTKAGGFVTYIVSSREIGDNTLTHDTARQKALEFLRGHNLENMEETYYEISGGICTINFAYKDGDVLCYTDLIKVGVAMDNGQIVFYDARGFVNNHTQRELPEPTLTVEEASKSISPLLEVQSTGLALIPTGGKNEVLTYEFKTKNAEGGNILVYVNVQTGAEEQILVLMETESGVLAM